MVASILAIYWLQPATPIRNLDFWLPTLSICLAIIVWAITVPKTNLEIRSNVIYGLMIAFVILIIGLFRYLNPICCLTPSQPPAIYLILIFVLAAGILITLSYLFLNGQRIWI